MLKCVHGENFKFQEIILIKLQFILIQTLTVHSIRKIAIKDKQKTFTRFLSFREVCEKISLNGKFRNLQISQISDKYCESVRSTIILVQAEI